MIISKTKIGVIGAGSISGLHLQSYQKLEDVELYAVCDLNQVRAEEKAKKYGIPHVYTDYRELLANPEVEAVSICTWNNTHAEISIAALRAGKHVLVEKPLCRTVEEALQIQEAVRETGKTLQVGFVRRYDANAQLVKRFIDNGELGEIYYAKASSLRRLGNPGGWFADQERSGGGPLIDIGVHFIDLCWYLMGRPKPVSVSGNTYKKLGNRAHVRNLSFYKAADYDPNTNGVEDMANALIRFENGASLLVDVSFTLHGTKGESTVKLYGDQGGVELEPELILVTEKLDTILNVSPQTNDKSINVSEAFFNEVSHFVSCCRTGSTPISPVEDGVTMMRMLCAIYESADKGIEIQL
ncbi:gfo/Idh/MocA family oxidoreductase [Paenibacillus sp. LMG 31458]|uniref:Gfo/Idh/MocA family oxidoreductase n=1 Tax=Paenibacillus phytorum TaxID=2654977 RepID=A0ABX1XRV8_9BACL|nr:Gfo/Idh/MocA family oxidoreductase [Paenibacillus phytorum]NOU71275.1 gfo/Idh/MocA family oxidoreductase [Paenibacillus phytorum]